LIKSAPTAGREDSIHHHRERSIRANSLVAIVRRLEQLLVQVLTAGFNFLKALETRPHQVRLRARYVSLPSCQGRPRDKGLHALRLILEQTGWRTGDVSDVVIDVRDERNQRVGTVTALMKIDWHGLSLPSLCSSQSKGVGTNETQRSRCTISLCQFLCESTLLRGGSGSGSMPRQRRVHGLAGIPFRDRVRLA
jgi:hypothetical protein